MKQRRVRWRRLVLGSLAAIGLGAWYLLRSHAFDPYRFLSGKSPVDVTILPPGSWAPAEARTYTWRANWLQVCAQARSELPRFGLAEEPISPWAFAMSRWMGEKIDGGPCGIGTDKSVLIARGRASPPPLTMALTDDDPNWVTVMATTDLEDNWINIVRYTFFACRD